MRFGGYLPNPTGSDLALSRAEASAAGSQTRRCVVRLRHVAVTRLKKNSKFISKNILDVHTICAV